MKYGIFTKPVHVEKLTNFLNLCTKIDYIISTRRDDLVSYDYDIGVSYCYPFIVDIDMFPKVCWFNYHPAPLPGYPGLDCYSKAISDGVHHFGVTLHKMTMKVDGGDIVKEIGFPLKSIPTSVNELGAISHYYLFQLFKETIEELQKG